MRKSLSIPISVVMACSAFWGGCAKKEAVPVIPVTLNVFAAAGLTEALNEIAVLYKAEKPEVTLSFNFNSSGMLQTQIENGANADLFFSAGQSQMNALAGKYIDDATRRDLLINRIVLIVPQGSTKGIASFEDCLTDKVSLIAFGNLGTPLGQFAEEIFKHLNGWEIVSAKASLGSTVKEVLSQVESKSVDCGIVWATDVGNNRVTVVADAPVGSVRTSVFPVAVIKDSPSAQAAKEFLDYMSTPQAVDVFERIGFKVVGQSLSGRASRAKSLAYVTQTNG